MTLQLLPATRVNHGVYLAITWRPSAQVAICGEDHPCGGTLWYAGWTKLFGWNAWTARHFRR